MHEQEHIDRVVRIYWRVCEKINISGVRKEDYTMAAQTAAILTQAVVLDIHLNGLDVVVREG